jgi:hypothetical protein
MGQADVRAAVRYIGNHLIEIRKATEKASGAISLCQDEQTYTGGSFDIRTFFTFS